MTLSRRIILPASQLLKLSLMFEFARCCHWVKKNFCLIKQCYCHCHIFNFILSVSCNNVNKLKLTLQFPLAKGIFNKTQVWRQVVITARDFSNEIFHSAIKILSSSFFMGPTIYHKRFTFLERYIVSRLFYSFLLPSTARNYRVYWFCSGEI